MFEATGKTGLVPKRVSVEWPTVALFAGCYGLWLMAVFAVAGWSVVGSVLLTALVVALHASLTHEVIHGHPFPGRARWNAAIAFPTLSLFIPFARFRDTHLAHHHDADLTDPYDDPETNYLDPETWDGLPAWLRRVLAFNNTLLGRVIVGPAWGLAVFLSDEWRKAWSGDVDVRRAWAWHVPQAGLVIGLVLVAPIPLWAYFVGVYLSMSIIKIRTFLEHQAHDRASGRTAIVEANCPLAFLFLNNNLHAVHHVHPAVPWYDLPGLYAARRDHFIRRNGGYVYRSYGEVFRRYFLARKDPVAHPYYGQD